MELNSLAWAMRSAGKLGCMLVTLVRDWELTIALLPGLKSTKLQKACFLIYMGPI